MMNKWALVIDERVVETTNIDPVGRFHPDMQWVACGDEVVAGWGFNGQKFYTIETPLASVSVPVSITPRQGVEMLIEADLYDTVVAYLAAIPGKDGMKARNRFERANEFRRDDPLVIAIATAQGMTTEQIDQMFIDAAQYE